MMTDFKKIFTGIALLSAVLAPLSCTKSESFDSQEVAAEGSSGQGLHTDVAVTPGEIAEAFFAPGQAVVTFSEQMCEKIESAQSDEALSKVMQTLGVTRLERLFPHAGEFEERTRAEGMHRYYCVEFDSSISLSKAQALFESIEGVEEFEKQYRVKECVSVNDTYFKSMWGLYGNYSIRVQDAWEYTMGNPKVIVSVVDGGIQLDHPDLEWNCSKVDNYNFVKNSTTISQHGHGTHVAGTIAGVTNNGKGVAGIAGGNYATGQRGVTLMSCQVFSDNDGTSSNFAGAIKWGADHGAVISQNSWGYNFDYNNDGRLTGEELTAALTATINSSLKSAVDYFIKYAGKDSKGNVAAGSPMDGGVVIFASGNDGIRNGAPANYAPIIAVGATTSTGRVADFSNYGPWVDICAPGQEIYSTYSGTSYAKASGTSMACPHVSGVAALILSYFADHAEEFGKGLYVVTNTDLEDMLIKGANPNMITYNGHEVGPYLDAYNSLVYGINSFRRANNHAPVIEMEDSRDLTFRQWESINIPIYVSDEDGDRLTVDCEVEGRGTILKQEDGSYVFSLLCELVTDFTPKKVKLTVSDPWGGEASLEFTYTVIENRAPVAVGKVDGMIFNLGDADATIDVSKLFTDPDEESLKFRAVSSAGSKVAAKISSDKCIISPKDAGGATITLTAADRLGKKAEISFQVLVREKGVEMEIYPNPVVDYLNIRTGAKMEKVGVKISSANGVGIFDAKLDCSAFAPGRIDMRSCAPGKYVVSVNYEGKITEKTIIKK